MRRSSIRSIRTAVLFALSGVAPVFAAQTINAAGGTTAGDGLRVTVGENMQLQITREGSGQLYSPSSLPPSTSMFNTVALAQGTAVYRADCSACSVAAGTI